jgi:transaldolase/glucose-6-phosphate isomerase
VSGLKASLPEALAAQVKTRAADWQSSGKLKRVWQRDATVWTGADEASWLDGLDVVDVQVARQDPLQKLAKALQGWSELRCVLAGHLR